jgi:hypothetical protein
MLITYAQKLCTIVFPWQVGKYKYKRLPMNIKIAPEVLQNVMSKRLDINSLKIQEGTEEVLTLLSGSENNSISNIILAIPIHTALIFKEQAKVKDVRVREKGLAETHYSIQHIEGYHLPCYKDNK